MDTYRDFIDKKRAALAKRGFLIDCSMINPDLPPPPNALRELAKYVGNSTNHRYTVARGIQELRESFADYYADRLGVNLDSESQICVTSGTKDALFHFLSAVCVTGDSVGVIAPVYPMYRQVVMSLGLQIVEADSLQGLSNVRAVVLNSPQNPTGALLNPDEVQRWAAANNVSIFHDAVYVDMVLGARSFLEQPLVPTVESFSLSKSFSVPGWRIGCVAGDPDIIGRIATRRSRLDYGVFFPIQKAASYLLSRESSYPRELALRYQHRGNLFRHDSAGLPFIWIRQPVGIADYLLDKFGIAVLPGATFSTEFEQYIRIALVLSDEKLLRVVESIEEMRHEISI